MENQEFQQHVLKWMERMEERQGAFEERIDRWLGALERDVSWIKGKLEGRSEMSAGLRANIAIVISIVVGFGSLLLSLLKR